MPLGKTADGKDGDWKVYMEKPGTDEHVYTTAEEGGEGKEQSIVLQEGGEEIVFEEEGGVIINEDELYQIEDGSEEQFEKVYYIINKN